MYVATRPETVLSVIKVGKLPDLLPQWVEPKVLEISTDCAAVIQSLAIHTCHNLFVLEIDYTHQVDYVAQQTNSTLLQVPSIDPKQIRKIIVYSKTGHNLLNKLLNSEISIPVDIKPELFQAKLLTLQPNSQTTDVAPTFKVPSFGHLLPNEAQLSNRVKIVRKGDILGSGMQTLINTVNCVGVMGKGLAYMFKQQYPLMFKEYQEKCKRNEVRIGIPYLYKTPSSKWILNFPTKLDWRNNSSLSYIEEGLKYLINHYKEWGITSLAIPPLGCGNGGLSWDTEVYPLIQPYLQQFDIPLEIYTPFEKPNANPKPIIQYFEARSSSSSSSASSAPQPGVKRKR